MSARRWWWLAVTVCWVGCGDEMQPPIIDGPGQDADQVMFGLQHYITSEGIVRAFITADTAYAFDDRQETELRVVRATFFDAVGNETSVLTATAGTVYHRTRDMEARGSVVVVSTDGRRLTTEKLRYTDVRNEISSQVPFVFQEPGRRLEGDSFVSDPDFTNVRAQGTRGTAGRVDIPK